MHSSWHSFHGSEQRMLCTVEIVREAHTALMEQLSLLFVTITETLTTQQLNYLKALIAGEKAISSTEVMHRYQISSTTSISRSKTALIKNDILDNKAGEISFQDPDLCLLVED